MADWKDYYKEHLVSMEEAAKQVKPGDVVWMGQGPEIPFAMLDEMHAHMEDYHDIFLIWNVSTYPFELMLDPEATKHFRMTSFFNLPLERMSGEMGVMEYHSCGYDHIDESFFEYGGNTIALQVCPPDENGWCNVGHYGVSTTSVIAHDPRITKRIGFMDRTGQYPIPGDHKDVAVHITDFDFIVENDTESMDIPAAPPTDVDKLIAGFIMPYIHQGDKLQIGFGGLGEEILANLKSVGPLEIYTEVCCDNMLELVQEGVLTKVTAASPGACSDKFFRALPTEPRITLIPRDRTIDLLEIMKQDNLVAINATFMVDLLGQACSEAQGLTPYSGVGGSFAYIYGAMRAKGGRSFLCLRSSYYDHDGVQHSNIVPWLPEKSIVTTPKNYQMFIVSEYGVADVYLKTMKDRIRALIKIAHPDFRQELKEQICTTSLISERDFEGTGI
ncbi:MAG: acetyl-CoA hydrolase/transferase C-terminal domain-containing protein [Oscillospiraceae bacterium]